MLKNDALEARIRGLIKSLERLIDSCMELEGMDYLIPPSRVTEYFSPTDYFKTQVGFYYIPRMIIRDIHTGYNIEVIINIGKKDILIFSSESRAIDYSNWCLKNYRLFGYGQLLERSSHHFSEKAYNELVSLICGVLNNNFIEKKNFASISLKDILDNSYKTKEIEISLDARYNKMNIFSFEVNREKFKNGKESYHFLELIEEISHEINITCEAETGFGCFFEIDRGYIEKIHNALNSANMKLLHYLVYKERLGEGD